MRIETSSFWPRARRLLLVPFIAGLSGCALPPSVPVMGAFFPGWLFCMTGGFLLTLLTRLALVRVGRERALGPPVLVYSALYALYSVLLWLIFF